MIYAFLSGKKDQDSYVTAFANAINAKIVHTKHFLAYHNRTNLAYNKMQKKILPNCRAIVLAGLLRGNYHILDMAIKNGIDFYYIDHAYFNSGYKYPHWMRVTKNGFSQNLIIPNANESRLKEKYNTTFKDYNYRDNKNIVVFPPSNTVSRVFGVEDWETKTVEEIRKVTDRPIIIRKKTGPVLDKRMINTVSKEVYHYEDSIDRVLEQAYCVVTFNSSVALTALEGGIPVICDRFCPAYPISNKLEDLENLVEYDRLPLFNSLIWGQFTKNEIGNLKTFNHINSITQWEGTMI